jgi:hypothetical protein
MKTFLTLLSSLCFTSMVWATPEPASIKSQLYTFKFKLAGETFEYAQKSEKYEEAFEKAAQACFNHYRNGQKLTEERGLDVIDVCANPRS